MKPTRSPRVSSIPATWIVCCLFSLGPTLALANNPAAPNPGMATHPGPSYAQLPLSFEANQGQTDERIAFIARGHGYTLLLSPTEATLALRKHDNGGLSATRLVRFQLLGAGDHGHLLGAGELAGKINYFLGNDPTKWHAAVPLYSRVEGRNVYPGIDLIYHGNQRHLEYDFVVAPGTEVDQIRLGLSGIECAHLGADGELVLETPDGAVSFHRPEVYQDVGGHRLPVTGQYVMRNENEVGFVVGAYDRSRPLVIDPVLQYSTYLGGSGTDIAEAIAVDGARNMYIAGETLSEDFPTLNAFQDTLSSGTNAFVTAINSSGSGLLYSTYLGGEDISFAVGLAVDGAGNAYVGGSTSSTNFPISGAVQAAFGGAQDGFLTKLDPTGALLFSTYLGGSRSDLVFAVTVQGANVYVAGQTTSADFITTNAFQSGCGSDGNCDFTLVTNLTTTVTNHVTIITTNIVTQVFSDAFLCRLSTNGNTLAYSTYFGGQADDSAETMTVDAAGNIYIAGITYSADLFVTNTFHTGTNFVTKPFRSTCGGGCTDPDAFITQFSPAGSVLYSTYLGGSGADFASGIAVDSSSNIYVVGTTSSSSFPLTIKPKHPADLLFGSAHGNSDVFLTELSTTTTNPTKAVYSVRLGGTGNDSASGIALTPAKNAVITGVTSSPDFPIYHASTNVPPDGVHAFIMKIAPSGTNFVYSTLVSGSGSDTDTVGAVALDASGNVYIAGSTTATDFPTVDPLQANNAGDRDAFVAKLAKIETDLGISAVPSADPAAVGELLSFTITVTNLGPLDAHNVLIHDVLPGTTTFSNSSVAATVDGRFLTLALGDLPVGRSTNITLGTLVTFVQTACNNFLVDADEDDPNPDNSAALTCVEVPVHDLAVVAVRTPKRVKLGGTGIVTVTIQNRSPDPEIITDKPTLLNLVTVNIASIGTSCTPPLAVLQTPRHDFPITIRSKGKFTARYAVTFGCANDPDRTTGTGNHDDFSYTAQVHHEAIDGLLDSHTADDICPHAALPGGLDQFPNGKVHDLGCPSAPNTDVIGP
jgi:uncharacterized repeat protein (TIGR01451 family)